MKNINRLLIIRLSSLGDVLLTTPVIRAIKNKYPEAKIDFLIREEYQDAIRFNPNLSNVILFKKNANLGNLIAELKDNNYDLVLDLQNNSRSQRITKNINAETISYKKNNLQKFLLVKFKYRKDTINKSVPERYIESFPELELDDKGLELFFHENQKDNLSKNESYIGLCPGSRHFSKMYPPEYFVELGKLISESGKTLVLFGGADDIGINEKLRLKLPDSINLTNNNNLLQTAHDMKFCEAIVCNDSGLMHAASAVQVPVIAIFGSTVKDFGFAPYNVPNLILENKLLTCRPCSHIGRNSCPKTHFKCMKEIYPHEVYESLTKLLSENV